MRKLTPKQEHFAQLVANGSRLNVAYREAYQSAGNSLTVRVEASRLVRHPGVAAAIRDVKRRTARFGSAADLLDMLRSHEKKDRTFAFRQLLKLMDVKKKR